MVRRAVRESDHRRARSSCIQSTGYPLGFALRLTIHLALLRNHRAQRKRSGAPLRSGLALVRQSISVRPQLKRRTYRPVRPPKNSRSSSACPFSRAFCSDGCGRSDRWISLPRSRIAQLKCPAGFSQGDTSSEYGYVVSVLIPGLWHARTQATSTESGFIARRGNKAVPRAVLLSGRPPFQALDAARQRPPSKRQCNIASPAYAVSLTNS